MDPETLFSQPFGVIWRSSLVRLPRAVPINILRWTVPEGPYPVILTLSSRGQHRIPVYAFIPSDLTADEANKLPVVLDFHGGGFYLGSCLEQAPFCAKMARELRAVVLSVDYRLGPVNKYPAAIEDAEDVVKAVIDDTAPSYTELRDGLWCQIRKARRDRTKGFEEVPHRLRIDRSRIAVSGFSSGGNLALNLGLSISESCEMAAWPSPFGDRHPHPIPLLLYYPSFDARQLPSERNRPTELPPASGFWSDVSDLLAPTYLPRDRAHEPRASPGLADLAGLHPRVRMLLVLPGIDDLSEQSEMWVRKVQEGGRGSELQVERFPTMKHGWTQMPESWLSEEEKSTRTEIFEKTLAFTKDVWDGKDIDGTSSHLTSRISMSDRSSSQSESIRTPGQFHLMKTIAKVTSPVKLPRRLSKRPGYQERMTSIYV